MVIIMNPILIQIGSISIRWYSALILLGIFLGYGLAEYEAKKFQISKDFMFNMTFWMVIFGLFGARIYYVVFNWQLYSHDLLSIFRFWEGGLAIHGGLLAGFITIYLYCKKYNMRFIKVLDIIVVSLILAQAIGRWGNFFNSEAHGPVTTLAILKSRHIIPAFVINGMNINGVYYEPTFYYESLWCFIGFILLIIIRNNKNTKIGTLTAFYLIWYSVGRFVVESLRTDSLLFGGFKMAQIVSIIMFIIGIIAIMINSRKTPFEDLYHDNNASTIKF